MSNQEGEKIPAPDDDQELVRRFQGGSMSAFEALVERHQKKMLNLAFRMTGSFEEACEVVQDAFISAYRGLPKFRGESRFSTWLYAITVNLSKNRRKQMSARSYREGISIDNPGGKAEGRPRFDPPSGGASILEQMEKKEVDAKVQDCIDRLDPEFREALVLRDIEGFSYGEIRGILKVPDGTVKSRLFRARDAVKDCLKKALGAL